MLIPLAEQMNQVSGLKPNMVSIQGGQRGTYYYTQNLDMKCGSASLTPSRTGSLSGRNP